MTKKRKRLILEKVCVRPSFLYSKGLTPAERGTALHSFLQFSNYAAAAENPQAELERLQAQGFLTKEQAEAVNRKQVGQFFQSQIAKRMLASSYLVREYRFAVEIPASQAAPESSQNLPLTDHTVVLQGAVDCAFEEDGELVIVDYKSDRSSQPEELWRRYHKQLELYAMAMEQCTGKPVKECLLYSFHWNQRISKTAIKTKTAPCISENKGLFLFLFGVFLSFHSQAQDSNQKYVFKTVIK